MITQRLVLNVDHESITPSLSMVQNDSGRQIEFSISDYVIASGTTAAVFFEKPSSTGDLIYISADVDDQTITVTVSPSVLSEQGTVRGQLVLYFGSEVLKSFIFNIDVEADLSRSATASSEDRELITQVVAELTAEMNNRFREMSAMGTFDDGLWVGPIIESLDDIDGDGVTGDSTYRLVLDPDKGIRFINDIGETTAIYPAVMAPALRYRGYTYYDAPDSYHKSYSNANNITEMGIWTINNDPVSSPLANTPANTQWGYLFVLNSTPDRSDLIQQWIVRANHGNGDDYRNSLQYIYVREKGGAGTWTDWVNLLDTSDISKFKGNVSYSNPDRYHTSYTSLTNIQTRGIWRINDNNIGGRPTANGNDQINIEGSYLIVLTSDPDATYIQQYIVRPTPSSGTRFLFAREKVGSGNWTAWTNLFDPELFLNYLKINPAASGDNGYDLHKLGVLTADSPSAVTVNSASWTTLQSITITPGIHHLDVYAKFPANATGYRRILLSETANNGTARAEIEQDYGVGHADTYTTLRFSCTIRNTTAANKTYYICGWQNSGAALSVTSRVQDLQLG